VGATYFFHHPTPSTRRAAPVLLIGNTIKMMSRAEQWFQEGSPALVRGKTTLQLCPMAGAR